MSEEVRLILTKLKIVAEVEEEGLYLCNRKDGKVLLDFINGLLKENEAYKNMRKEAIKYIKEHSEVTDLKIYGIDNVLAFRGDTNDLLNILNKVGENDETNNM